MSSKCCCCPHEVKHEHTVECSSLIKPRLTVIHEESHVLLSHEKTCSWMLLPAVDMLTLVVFLSSVPSYSASSQTTN